MNQTDKLLPRYIKFARQLQAMITSGSLPPGEMLPAQRELAQQCGTTLMTIRKAINVLEEEGLIRSEHGVGTFVTCPELQEEPYQLFSLSSEMNRRSTGETETQVLSVESTVYDEKACRALKLPTQSPVSRLDRLRIKHGMPFAYQRSFLPPQFADMLRQYTTNASLYGLLQKETGHAMAMAKEYLQPIVVSGKQARLLHCANGEPAWLSIRISTTQEGTPMVYDEATLRHDSFVMTVDHIGRRTNCQLNMIDDTSTDVFRYLIDE